jgi:hypothetical protein
MTDNERIASLTSGAIKVSGDKVIADIWNTVEVAEHTVKMMREEAEVLTEQIKVHVNLFAERVNTFVTNCNDAVELFQSQQVKISSEEVLEAKPVLPPMITDEDLKMTGT